MVACPSEEDSPQSGPASGGVGSVVFSKGLGVVSPAYGFNWNPFTFCGRISPASVPSMNVPFFAATIQYVPVHTRSLRLREGGPFPFSLPNSLVQEPRGPTRFYASVRNTVTTCIRISILAHMYFSSYSSSSSPFSGFVDDPKILSRSLLYLKSNSNLVDCKFSHVELW